MVMRNILILLCLFTGMLTAQGANSSNKKQMKLEKEKEIRELIESGNFRFLANSANPMSGRSINLTSNYDLKIYNDTIETWLPFFGRAYSVDYGGDGGIKFKEQAVTIDKKFNSRKKIYEYSIVVKTSQDKYTINLSTGLNGYGNLYVRSQNRQPISFYGTIEALDRK